MHESDNFKSPSELYVSVGTDIDTGIHISILIGKIAVLESKNVILQAEINNLRAEIDNLTYDKLTGLLCASIARKTLESLVNEGNPFALIFGDLDGLKQINDRFGHDRGDELIATTGEILRNHFRDTDVILGRPGGDEIWGMFSLAPRDEDSQSPSISPEERVKIIKQRFKSQVNAGLDQWKQDRLASGEDIGYVGFSVGSAMFKPGDSPDDVINRASKAMAKDKQTNKKRNGVVINN
jgi:diguanylate cyclase (GGDEF)-like protein